VAWAGEGIIWCCRGSLYTPRLPGKGGGGAIGLHNMVIVGGLFRKLGKMDNMGNTIYMMMHVIIQTKIFTHSFLAQGLGELRNVEIFIFCSEYQGLCLHHGV